VTRRLAVAAGALAMAACSSGPQAVTAGSSAGLPPLDPAGETPRVDPIAPAARTFVGVITTKQSKVVVAQFEGRLDALLVQAGQAVRAGEPIARLDSTQLAQQADVVRGQAAAARSAAAQAGIDLAEAKRLLALESRLLEGDASTAEAVRSARANVSRAGAARSQAYAAYTSVAAELSRLEDLLANATLAAPIDGVVSMIRLKEGELAVPGTPVARIFDPSDRWVRFAMPADSRDPDIRIGTQVEVSVAVAQDRPTVLAATVVGVSSVLEPPLQLTVVEADLDDTRPETSRAEIGSTVDVRRLP